MSELFQNAASRVSELFQDSASRVSEIFQAAASRESYSGYCLQSERVIPDCGLLCLLSESIALTKLLERAPRIAGLTSSHTASGVWGFPKFVWSEELNCPLECSGILSMYMPMSKSPNLQLFCERNKNNIYFPESGQVLCDPTHPTHPTHPIQHIQYYTYTK